MGVIVNTFLYKLKYFLRYFYKGLLLKLIMTCLNMLAKGRTTVL